MPRKKSPPRLWLEHRHGRESMWLILDQGRKIRTGFPERNADAAKKALAHYIVEKHEPSGEHHPSAVLIAEVLSFYLRERVPRLNNQANPKRHIRFLAEWWKEKTIASIKGQSCRAYVTWRSQRALRGDGISTARHDLETLSAAVNFYHNEFTLNIVPTISMPASAPPREEWVTRNEVAALLRAVRRRPEARHVGRFILIGVYTGTRSQAILGLRWLPSTQAGWIDLDHHLLYRRGKGQKQTKKRTPPARIHDRLLPHLKRWHRLDSEEGITNVIHFKGKGIKKMRRSWLGVRDEAKLDQHIVLHTFRHTAVTWMLQAGGSAWEVAGYVGMSVKMIEDHYGHHHPDYQSMASKAVAPRKRNGGLGA